ncbi:uncharacterized protein LOC131250859 isoform X2 [Magnolia sinica]|nr:uncharacterized protein LOC131250859 isoform X2 [Magnolia sinica]XP_058107207.1 uncharacterized protein LOC131250859 isoform X2 [Magnolia sinica]XP_058107208.1 uncharacterized protein LOC131250859 isoform X2 [Magnolia sinica]XP_058107209.1 uncharacterized protein LOC131250859 isoform X2 [Magnolia sinica]
MSTRPSMATRARPLIQDQNLLIHNEGGGAAGVHGSKVLQKKGPGTRKALANITNSEKLSSHKASKKNQPTKFANIGVPTIIEEEQCLHNHQSCISLQTATTNVQTAASIYFQKTLGVDDDANSQLDLWSPKTPRPLSSSQGKVGFESTPRYLDFTQTPVLKLQSSVRRSILWSPISPSMY